MPIEIIVDTEERVFQIEDAKIFYRRMPVIEKTSIVQKYTKYKNGRETLNTSGYMRELFGAVTIRWENINMNGKAADYTIDNLMRLPEKVLLSYLQELDKLDSEIREELEEQEKN